ncbi:hypothetical protein [Heyndrickxia oleronia]|uniref:hypothetical protein n=1 Tax=Heyndrickxia oleronia TaxID=38875 RepID=UPI0033382BE3
MKQKENMGNGLTTYQEEKLIIHHFKFVPKVQSKIVFVTLPNGKILMKKCLFINKEYIRKIVGLNQYETYGLCLR